MALEATQDVVGMSIHFSDADPVINCLIKDCKKHFHGDAVVDAFRNWYHHIPQDHPTIWNDE